MSDQRVLSLRMSSTVVKSLKMMAFDHHVTVSSLVENLISPELGLQVAPLQKPARTPKPKSSKTAKAAKPEASDKPEGFDDAFKREIRGMTEQQVADQITAAGKSVSQKTVNNWKHGGVPAAAVPAVIKAFPDLSF